MWRHSVNDALRRLTGYQLQRASRADENERQLRTVQRKLTRLYLRLGDVRKRLQEVTAERDRARRRLKAARARFELAERQLGAAKARAQQLERGKSKQEKSLPNDYDEAAVRILRQVQSRTMTDSAKLFGLVEATRYVVKRGIPGDIVECGVWRGGSMQAVALTLIEEGTTDRRLHLFDTFEGMPPPTEKDRRNGTSAEEMLASHDKDHRIWAIADLDDVQEAMRDTRYPSDLIELHPGLVEETVPIRAPAQISLLRLDTDWYESTRHELEHLYDRLSPGGVLIIDDYGDWDGARLATEEFLARLPEPLLLIPIGTGRLAVKPLS